MSAITEMALDGLFYNLLHTSVVIHRVGWIFKDMGQTFVHSYRTSDVLHKFRLYVLRYFKNFGMEAWFVGLSASYIRCAWSRKGYMLPWGAAHSSWTPCYIEQYTGPLLLNIHTNDIQQYFHNVAKDVFHILWLTELACCELYKTYELSAHAGYLFGVANAKLSAYMVHLVCFGILG